MSYPEDSFDVLDAQQISKDQNIRQKLMSVLEPISIVETM